MRLHQFNRNLKLLLWDVSQNLKKKVKIQQKNF
jgi:hypothetical protein